MLSKETISTIKDSNVFAEFRDFIFSKINELNSVDGLGEMDNDKAGEEAKIRLKTASKLSEILEPIIGFREKKEPSVDEVNTVKKKHGL